VLSVDQVKIFTVLPSNVPEFYETVDDSSCFFYSEFFFTMLLAAKNKTKQNDTLRSISTYRLVIPTKKLIFLYGYGVDKMAENLICKS